MIHRYVTLSTVNGYTQTISLNLPFEVIGVKLVDFTFRNNDSQFINHFPCIKTNLLDPSLQMQTLCVYNKIRGDDVIYSNETFLVNPTMVDNSRLKDIEFQIKFLRLSDSAYVDLNVVGSFVLHLIFFN